MASARAGQLLSRACVRGDDGDAEGLEASQVVRVDKLVAAIAVLQGLGIRGCVGARRGGWD